LVSSTKASGENNASNLTRNFAQEPRFDFAQQSDLFNKDKDLGWSD